MKPPKKEIKKWVKALRSGKYKQSHKTLQNDFGHCCLGVACEILAPNYERKNGYLRSALPIKEHGAPIWLAEVDDNFQSQTGEYLFKLNDREGFTFDEIADCLEAVYIHEVLS